jgi:hypothetical protein
MLLDGKTGPSLSQIDRGIFSPDSKHLAYAARSGSQWTVCLDEKLGPFFDEIDDTSIQFSSDSKHLAYFARKESKWFAVNDERAGPPFDQVELHSLVFNHGGQHLAYVARTYLPNGGFASQIVVDGNSLKDIYETAPEAWPHVPSCGPSYSPDGKRFAYVTTRPIVPPPPHIHGPPPQTFTVSAMIDGRLGPPFQAVALTANTFSPDGKHTVYFAYSENDRFMVVDGVPGPPVGGIVCGPVFRPDGTLEYLARIMEMGEPVLYRITHRFH